MAATSSEVIQYITKEASDEDLQVFNALIVRRLKAMRAAAGREIASQLKVGDFVRFVDTIKPTYLQSRRARVVEFRQTKLTVELLDGPIGKFRSGKVICPPSCLRIIDAPRSFIPTED